MHKTTPPNPFALSPRTRWWPACVLALLAACGGADNTPTAATDTPAAAPLASGVTTLQVDNDTLPDAAAAIEAQPTFHAAPLLLDAPDDTDTLNPAASATHSPRKQSVPAALAGLSTRRLTVDALEAAARTRRLDATANADGSAAPAAAAAVVATYSPAQIRAAYGLPALPASMSALTTAQAAALGAGQTIYIVNANHNPNVVAELAAFNTKFGLPACTTKTIAVTATLPLAKPDGTGCEFSVVYNTAAGVMTTTAPAYESGWATEIALDVQWAHATAPLARIVLIEAPNASLDSLLGGVKLANKMGPGVVSMSFGAAEGSYTASVDSAFTGTGMTYLAATGDWGAGVYWPSVSSNVVAVGGTTLSYGGSGARSETAWSGTGGGMSAFTARPAYQTGAVPGLGTPARRMLADVAFNADPSSGQYVAVIKPGATTPQWMSVGGTSLSTPQWAGFVAVANAQRALAAKPTLGGMHALLYGNIGAVPGTYAGAFADIVQGSNGTCAGCSAKAGYDALTGLGTPNVGNLLAALGGTTVAVTPPVVTPAAIAGVVGTPLSFTASVTAANPVTYTLAGAPAGMAIATTGVVAWTTPLTGTYAVNVIAKDTKTGLSGQGTYTVTIAAAKAPTLTGTTVTGKAGTALSFSAAATSANPVTYTMAGAPSGMAISTAGLVSWAAPVAGTYAVTVTAKDTKTALSGSALYTVQIAGSTTLAISAPGVTGIAGKALSAPFTVSAPGATGFSLSIAGAPLGMTFSASGTTFTASWASPVTGTYSLKINVVDSLGRTAAATLPITINAK